MAKLESMAVSNESQIATDLPEFIAVLTEMKEKASDLLTGISNLHNRVNEDELRTEKGISFLEVKHHLSLDYLINLVYLLLLKVDGKPIKGAPAVERLTEIRTVIEKIRPVDQKLKYQIDKLVKMTADSNASTNPLSFGPNPGNLAAKAGIDDEEDNDDGGNEKSGVYVPPRVTAVPYDEDTWASRKRKLEERMKAKTLNSSLIKDLRDEYSEAPEEIKDDSKMQRAGKAREDELERERYEEDNLIRLNLGKKDKRSKNESGLRELTKFESFGFENEDEMGDAKQSKKSKKGKSFKKGKKKKFKPKRKKH